MLGFFKSESFGCGSPDSFASREIDEDQASLDLFDTLL